MHLVPGSAHPSPFDQPQFRPVREPGSGPASGLVDAPHGSTDHCNRTSSGPTLRPLPQPPTDVPWPSVQWHAHYRACGLRRRCPHRFEFPDWWLAMRNRGLALHPDADVALQKAVTMVNGYKGHPALLPDPLLFTQQAVLDALAMAPTPIGYSWMRITLSAVAGLSRWAHSTGQPLTREHLLGEETRYRYVEWAARQNEWTEGSKNLTWTRLELIGDFLLGVTRPRELRKPTITEEAPVEPLTDAEQADLWVWAKTLSVKKRVKRMTAYLALGLGCGLTGGELARATRDDVVIDDDGAVHVTVVSAKSTRTVTCLAHWEERLADIVRAVEPGHLLTAPWRTEPGHGSSNESVRRAMAKNPPVVVNSIRLRNTWLCWHLAHGTPLKELMQGSDMKEANHLHNLLPLLPETDPNRTARLLRGNPPRPPLTIPIPETDISLTVCFTNRDRA